jgi:hypothetical protein
MFSFLLFWVLLWAVIIGVIYGLGKLFGFGITTLSRCWYRGKVQTMWTCEDEPLVPGENI